jgi:hypothetical protein
MCASRECPLCKSQSRIVASGSARQIIESSPYYSSESYATLGLTPESPFRIARCESCDFCFTSEIPSLEILDRLYGQSTDPLLGASVFARPARAAFAFESLAVLLREISNRVACDARGVPVKPVRIIDIGCAYAVGSVGLTFPGYPYELIGVEWSLQAREYLNKYGCRTFKTIDDVPSGFMVDGILLNDVLEHLPDPVAFINQVKRICHAKTVIWVNVPNFVAWRMAHIIRQINSGSLRLSKDVNPWEHLSYFSPRSLNALFARIQFRRLPSTRIESRFDSRSVLALVRSWVRVNRDILRYVLGSMPDKTVTHGVFEYVHE